MRRGHSRNASSSQLQTRQQSPRSPDTPKLGSVCHLPALPALPLAAWSSRPTRQLQKDISRGVSAAGTLDFMLRKRSRISGFCISALLPPLGQGSRAAAPKDGSVTGAGASYRHGRNEVLERTLRPCRIPAATLAPNAPCEIRLPGKQDEAFTQPVQSLLLSRHRLASPSRSPSQGSVLAPF